jgi:GAF domain-containing protein
METQKKKGRYQRIYRQLTDLLEKPGDPDARMSTVVAVLHHKMEDFFWTGFYCLNEGELIVRTYQGPVACQLLEKDKGVCWAGINQGKTIIVPDVHKFPGHIACDPRSKSEIVVPLRDNNNNIIGVLDVDSSKLDSFDEVDSGFLEKIVDLVYRRIEDRKSRIEN